MDVRRRPASTAGRRTPDTTPGAGGAGNGESGAGGKQEVGRWPGEASAATGAAEIAGVEVAAFDVGGPPVGTRHLDRIRASPGERFPRAED